MNYTGWSLVVLLAAAPPSAVAQTAAPPSTPSPYRVGPRDVLSVTVFGHAELSGKFTVAADGSLLLPMIGTVRVAGLPAPEIQTEVTERFADGYLKDPKVLVEVQQFESQRVFVMGEIRSPGPVVMSGPLTLIEALARAGSLTEQAGGEIVVLRNQANAPPRIALAPGQAGTSEVARVSVQQLRRGALPNNIELQSGDSIFVPRAESVYVLGLVNNPGPYTFEPGITVVRVISLAGGVTPLGSTGRVRIIRVVDGKKVELKARLDDVLQPGDTVSVHARVF